MTLASSSISPCHLLTFYGIPHLIGRWQNLCRPILMTSRLLSPIISCPQTQGTDSLTRWLCRRRALRTADVLRQTLMHPALQQSFICVTSLCSYAERSSITVQWLTSASTSGWVNFWSICPCCAESKAFCNSTIQGSPCPLIQHICYL